MFVQLGQRKLPVDKSSDIGLPYDLGFGAEISADGTIPGNWSVPLDILPKRFQNVVGEIRSELSAFIQEFVCVLRWTQRATGNQHPFRFVGGFWSADKQTWHTLPMDVSIHIGRSEGIDTTENILERAILAWEDGAREPLGHEMAREALGLASTNPRSALLVGVSALETGLKEFIGKMAPDTTTLLEKSPMPPVISLIQDVIPSLIALKDADLINLEKSESDFLKKWIYLRNRIAHGQKSDIDRGGLDKLLTWISRLLYKLDSLSGQSWAENFAVTDPISPLVVRKSKK